MNAPRLSPLQQTTALGGNDYWNDSCSVEELSYAVANGAVGATSNPTIVLAVLKKELAVWREPLLRIIEGHPTWTEVEVAWRLIEEMALEGRGGAAADLQARAGRARGESRCRPIRRFTGTRRRLWRRRCTSTGWRRIFRSRSRRRCAGITAIEEATFRGVNVNATVCFTLPQSIAVAEAVERGLARRARAGQETASLTPVCTLMIGRLDDWLKVVARKDGIVLTPGHLDWAGIAVIKKAYGLFQQRGYRARLLAAAYRHHLHWSELIGGDLVQTIPYEWQLLFNHSDIEVKKRMHNPVEPVVVEELCRKFADFRRAYDENGMSPKEFDRFGATVRTLRTFIGSYAELLACVRDFMLPDPDLK